MKKTDYTKTMYVLRGVIEKLSEELDEFPIPDNSGRADIVAREIDVLKKARAVLKLHGHD